MSSSDSLADRIAFPHAAPPVLAALEDLSTVTVCTRPFRAAGPRIEAEQLGSKRVVHNYGHGGSGWSLSWGSGAVALDLALAARDPGATDLAVIGCGAIGLTAAILAQRAGVRSVTIYAKDRPAQTRSFVATGSWTPFSRVALRSAAAPGFAAHWEQMTRTSWAVYQHLLAQPAAPAAFTNRFYLSDLPPDQAEQQKIDTDPIGFVNYRDRIADLAAPFDDYAPGTHPFPARYVRRRSEIMFNITALVEQLTDEFLTHGGRIVPREFHSPADFAALPEPVLLNCTGYAARKLFGDDSLLPIRGQIAWLPPQPTIPYGIYSGNLTFLSRPDRMVVQLNPQGDASGWNDASEQPDLAEAEDGLRQLLALNIRPAVASVV